MATIDPRLLSVDANVRADADLTPDFVDAVREHGVIVPIIVRRDTLDQPHVIDGQRRTLAAIEAGLASVPIVWTDGVGDEETRIVDQLVINDHRAGLRSEHRVAAYQQLSLIGRSPEAIAKRTSRPVEEVTAALAVAESAAATAAAAAHPTMPLDVAAAVAEFEDDEGAVQDIVSAFEADGDATHAIAYARDEAEQRRALAEVVARLTAEGVVAYVEPGYGKESPYPNAEKLLSLTDEPGADGYPPRIADEAHLSCPHRGVSVQMYYGGRIGEVEVCLDWKAAGHHKRDARNTAGATSGPKSEEEKAAARVLRENRKKADVEKQTRHNWWAEFLQRRTIPAESAMLAGQLLALTPQWNQDGMTAAWALLGVDGVSSHQRVENMKRVTSKKVAQAFLLAYGVATFENTLHRDYFEDPKNAVGLREYFEQMVAWGYVLGDVEKAALKVAKRARR